MTLDAASDLSAASLRFRERLDRERDLVARAGLLREWARASRAGGKAGIAATLCEQALQELGEALPRKSFFPFGKQAPAAPPLPASAPPAEAERARLEALCGLLEELAAAGEGEGNAERADGARRRAVEIAAGLGSSVTYVRALGLRCVALAEMADLDRAHAHVAALERVASAAEGEAPRVAALARSFEAGVLLELGRLPEARSAAVAARRLAGAGGEGAERLAAALAAARVAALAGDAMRAVEAAAEAAALASAAGDPAAEDEARALSGFAQGLCGREVEGRRIVARACARIRERGEATLARRCEALAAVLDVLAGARSASEGGGGEPGAPVDTGPCLSRALPGLLEAERALAASGGAGAPRAVPLAEAVRLADRARRLATKALDACEGSAPLLAARARRIAGAAAAERQEPGAIESLERALLEARTAGGTIEVVEALVALGRHGERLAGRDPAPLYREAIARAKEAGALLLGRSAGELLDRGAGARRDVATELAQLEALVEVGRALSSILELEPLLERVMDAVVSLLGAERGFIMLYGADGALAVRVARNIDRERLSGPELQVSRTAVAEVESSGEPLLVVDSLADARFRSQLSVMDLGIRSILCYPLRTPRKVLGVLYADGRRVMELLRSRDAEFVLPFVSQAAIAIENASAYQRILVLYEETLSVARAREKILHHLSHELTTPVGLIQGALGMLGRKCAGAHPSVGPMCSLVEDQLRRLVDLQLAIEDVYGRGEEPRKRIALGDFLRKLIAGARGDAEGREVEIVLDAPADLAVEAPIRPLGIAVASVIKNAIENTPDEGRIEVSAVRREDGRAVVAVRDYGVGIVADHQRHLFDGFFHTQETERYSSKRPYAFNAGGKGLDLLRVKSFAERFGWTVELESVRCGFIPEASDVCPGRISLCKHCGARDDCLRSGATAIRLALGRAL